MSDMPKEIWVSDEWVIDPSDNENLMSHAETMGYVSPSTKYLRADPDTITISREELENMRMHKDDKFISAIEWNALIDKLLGE